MDKCAFVLLLFYSFVFPFSFLFIYSAHCHIHCLAGSNALLAMVGWHTSFSCACSIFYFYKRSLSYHCATFFSLGVICMSIALLLVGHVVIFAGTLFFSLYPPFSLWSPFSTDRQSRLA